MICAAVSVDIGARASIGADMMIFDTDFHNPEAVGRRYAASDWKRKGRPTCLIFSKNASGLLQSVLTGTLLDRFPRHSPGAA